MLSLENSKFADYEVLETLREGFQVNVYRVQKQKGVSRVLKLFKNQNLLRKKRQDLGVLPQLEHPHLASIYDMELTGEQPFLLMEYYTEGSITKKVKEKSLSLKEKIDIISTIAEALAYLHGNDIIHTDIRLENIFLKKNENNALEGCLSDVGLIDTSSKTVRAFQSHRRLFYHAPELIRQPGQVSPQTDIYALGICMYETIVGRKPYDASNYLNFMIHAKKGVFTPPSELVEGISTKLDEICLRAVSIHKEERYPSALELAEDLKNLSNVLLEPKKEEVSPTLDFQNIHQRIFSGESKSLALRKILSLEKIQGNPFLFDNKMVVFRRAKSFLYAEEYCCFSGEQKNRYPIQVREEVSSLVCDIEAGDIGEVFVALQSRFKEEIKVYSKKRQQSITSLKSFSPYLETTDYKVLLNIKYPFENAAFCDRKLIYFNRDKKIMIYDLVEGMERESSDFIARVPSGKIENLRYWVFYDKQVLIHLALFYKKQSGGEKTFYQFIWLESLVEDKSPKPTLEETVEYDNIWYSPELKEFYTAKNLDGQLGIWKMTGQNRKISLQHQSSINISDLVDFSDLKWINVSHVTDDGRWIICEVQRSKTSMYIIIDRSTSSWTEIGKYFFPTFYSSPLSKLLCIKDDYQKVELFRLRGESGDFFQSGKH